MKAYLYFGDEPEAERHVIGIPEGAETFYYYFDYDKRNIPGIPIPQTKNKIKRRGWLPNFIIKEFLRDTEPNSYAASHIEWEDKK